MSFRQRPVRPPEGMARCLRMISGEERSNVMALLTQSFNGFQNVNRRRIEARAGVDMRIHAEIPNVHRARFPDQAICGRVGRFKYTRGRSETMI